MRTRLVKMNVSLETCSVACIRHISLGGIKRRMGRGCTDIIHQFLNSKRHPKHHGTDDGLHRDDPRLPATDRGKVDGVDDGRPEQLERVRVTGKRKRRELGV